MSILVGSPSKGKSLKPLVSVRVLMPDPFTMRRTLSLLLFALPALSVLSQTDTITVGALERTFTTRLPSVYDGAVELPLVIAMHGGFGSGEQLEARSQLSVKAEAEGFIVVYPDGVPSLIGMRNPRLVRAGN